MRWIPTDARQRMDVDALRARIDADTAEGVVPFMVVGTAGSVSTGAIDPLTAIGALCRERGLWFHVDGAYGGFAAALPDAPPDLVALSDADSVAVDPHKWLYAPLEAGCALVRDAAHLRQAFSYHPAYYHFEQAVTNFVDLGPQNSRGFRALKVWLALQHAGAAGYRRMMADDIALARALAAAVERHPDLARVTPIRSSTTGRYEPRALTARAGVPGGAADRETRYREILDGVPRGGRAVVSNALVDGRYLMRAGIVNFHPSKADVAALPGIVADAGRHLDAAQRPAALGPPD
jgi:glutamate/tyrosine decarboxylase-like PLP-dependent enzyme